VDNFDDGSTVKVGAGQRCGAAQRSFHAAGKGQSLSVHAGSAGDMVIGRAVDRDDFDHWVSGRIESEVAATNSSSQYVNSPITPRALRICTLLVRGFPWEAMATAGGRLEPAWVGLHSRSAIGIPIRSLARRSSGPRNGAGCPITMVAGSPRQCTAGAGTPQVLASDAR